MMTPTLHRHGWRPDIPDQRDYQLPAAPVLTLLSHADLRPGCPPVVDQGNLGSCTANAIAGAFDYERKRQGLTFMAPSRLFVYYGERAIEGTISSDAGASIRDGMKVIAKQGVCPEAEWPYKITKFKTKPTAKCFTDALKNEALQYLAVTHTLAALKACLAAGFPFVFGFTVYESFESDVVAKTGIVPMPAKGESVLGGHAVLAVGYDDASGRFIVRNSWGTGWGDAGYFYFPYAYATGTLASDFWTIRTVEGT